MKIVAQGTYRLKYFLGGLIFFGIVASYVGIFKRTMTNINVFFPVSTLLKNKGLVNPSDTETIWEYYLLENLSCGITRDSKKSSSGYDGCLSDKFYQEDDFTWIFKLKNTKWSDGSSISTDDISEWVNNLTDKEFRHIKYFKNLKNFNFDADSKVLKLVFNKKTGTEILHELSLADAAVYKANSQEKNWNVTSGPYFVQSVDKENSKITLSKNKFYFELPNDAPDTITLLQPEGDKAIKMVLEKKIDIYPITATASENQFEKLNVNNNKFFISIPTGIQFFKFNTKNPYVKNRSARLLLFKALSDAFSEFHIPEGLNKRIFKETQLIPEGFSGRLREHIESWQVESDKFQEEPIKLCLYKYLENHTSLIENIKKNFLNYGLKTEIFFEKMPYENRECMVAMYTFVGNQLDVSGSWEFLLGTKDSPLGEWKHLVQKEYDEAFLATGKEAREEAFAKLHKKVLDENIAIPVFIGSQAYYVSDRIDVSSWSKIDARMRFWQIKILQ